MPFIGAAAAGGGGATTGAIGATRAIGGAASAGEECGVIPGGIATAAAWGNSGAGSGTGCAAPPKSGRRGSGGLTSRRGIGDLQR